ncbi:MAG: hypothetical protein IKG87_00360 [Clostridia bacterium]|nr:hypothetical protein [Clostridia bacterium]
MKRMIIILLVWIILCSCAFADRIREQIDAPASYQHTFDSPSGQSHIFVDAEVVVPDVEKISLYRVAACTVPESFVDKVLDYFGIQDFSAVQSAVSNPAGLVSVDNSFWEFTEPETGMIVLTRTMLTSLEDRTVETIFEYSLSSENTGRLFSSESEAWEIADNAVAELFPDHICYSTDSGIYSAVYEDESGTFAENDVCRFYYARLIDHIPAAHTFNYIINLDYESMSGEDSYSLEMPYELLYVDVGAAGICRIVWENPFQIGEKLTERCALLPFDRIISIFSTAASLSIAGCESRLTVNNMSIDRIELNYMVLQDKNNPLEYILTPVWDFFGSRTTDYGEFAYTDYSLCTINATDGTVIDRKYGY